MLAWRNILAAAVALRYSIQYGYRLRIRRHEWGRYTKKSVHLALCYADLVPSHLRAVEAAGSAAFLCCAYDVVTDWRAFDTLARREFERLLTRLVAAPAARRLATDLYEMERTKSLSDDGLERGPFALRFILALAGDLTQADLPSSDVLERGRLLQIVDDVLDYEDDVANGEQNCLMSSGRSSYLREMLELDPAAVARLFGVETPVLGAVVALARRKAARLLEAVESAAITT